MRAAEDEDQRNRRWSWVPDGRTAVSQFGVVVDERLEPAPLDQLKRYRLSVDHVLTLEGRVSYQDAVWAMLCPDMGDRVRPLSRAQLREAVHGALANDAEYLPNGKAMYLAFDAGEDPEDRYAIAAFTDLHHLIVFDPGEYGSGKFSRTDRALTLDRAARWPAGAYLDGFRSFMMARHRVRTLRRVRVFVLTGGDPSLASVRDHGLAFVEGPRAFIRRHAISLLEMIPLDTTVVLDTQASNVRARFTLSQAADDPCAVLRMLPTGPAPNLKPLTALFLNMSPAGSPIGQLPYCDIPSTPGPGDPALLFTNEMNGCSLIVASVVPPEHPPLAHNHLRVFHDKKNRPLSEWDNADLLIRFASYADDGSGPIPLTFQHHGTVVTNYNPNGYAWDCTAAVRAPEQVIRGVTNFLHHDGVDWWFHSRHYLHVAAARHGRKTPTFDLDALPPETRSSTQSIRI